VKTSQLSGAALDWAVASIELTGHDDYTNVLMVTIGDDNGWKYNPSTNWSQGGAIIEREGIALYLYGDGEWNAMTEKECKGKTPLEAAMRCYVASKLGDEVEVPDELLQTV
jgi:hypothetical protein